MKRIKRYINPLLNNQLEYSSPSFTLPKLTVIGQNHLYIENHRELILFTENELKLKLHKGYVRITGESFVLKTMLQQEILLEGLIKNIEFIV